MYKLSRQIGGHNGEVRCCCELGNGKFITGGFDASCVVWSLRSDSGDLVKEREIFGHSDFIYSVCPSPTNSNWFVSASKDRNMIVFDSENGEKILSFPDSQNVHKGPICSLAIIPGTSLVVAGSWDGSFSVWIAESGELVMRKENAGSHAITVAFCPSTQSIVTGSQDKALRFWSIESGDLVFEVPNAHEDIIRCIAVATSGMILTASNDCSIKLWSAGDSSATCLGQVFGHSNFIFSVSFSPSGETFYTASEDRTCRIWSTDRLTEIQSINLPGTVWFARPAGSENIITGCSDGFVRTFSSALMLHATQEELAAYDSLCTASGNAEEKEKIDPSTVAPESDMIRYCGKKIGEIKMFKNITDEVFAYQWTALGAWEKVGLVTGGTKKSSEKKFYAGDQYFPQGQYDYVFDVELGEAGRMALLPINRSDNPLVASEKFCARESINKSNLSHIIDFIKNNVQGMDSAGPASLSGDAAVQSSTHFPLIQPFLFRDAKWPQLMAKLREVDSTLLEDSRLTPVELMRLESLVEKLQNNQHVSEFTAVDSAIIFNKLTSKFPIESMFVIFDLWRLVILNPTVAGEMFKNSDGGSSLILTAARQLKANFQNNMGMCCARFLSNIFANSVSKWALMDRFDLVIDVILTGCDVSSGASKQTQLACASVLANIASAMTEKKKIFSHEFVDRVLGMLETGKLVVSDSDVAYRIGVALGCFLIASSDENQKDRIKEITKKISQNHEIFRDIIAA